MTRDILCAAIIVSGGVVSAAGASVTFSFASDDNPDGPTWFGSGTGIFDADAADAGAVNVDLLVDPDGDLGGGSTAFASVFHFDGTTTFIGTVPGEGLFAHVWIVGGGFSFEEMGTDLPVLTVSFQAALLISWSASPDTLGPTMTLQDSEAVDPALLFLAGPPLNGLGIYDGSISESEDFAFTFTDIRSIATGQLPLIDGAGNFIDPWIADGSFSASAIPGPGALAMLGCSLLAARRRRRPACSRAR